MSTRGDLYLRSNRTAWDRPFGQHFTIQHDAYPEFFQRTFREAYALHKEEGYSLENCITLKHPRMLEANADRYGGFYANIDMVDNHAELGSKEYGEHKVYFRGSVDELLAMEEWMLDSELCFRVWGRYHTDRPFQWDYADNGKELVLSDFASFGEQYEVHDEEIMKKLRAFFASADKQFTACWKDHKNVYIGVCKIPKSEYVSPEAREEIIRNDDSGVYM